MPVSHPIRTLLANAIASLLLGFITYISFTAFDLPDTVKLGLTVGFCGGLSTFSTFSAESIQLLQEGTLLSFFLYAFGTMAFCFFDGRKARWSIGCRWSIATQIID